MSNNKLSTKQLIEIVRAYEEAGGTKSVAAHNLNMPPSTFHSRLQSARRAGLLPEKDKKESNIEALRKTAVDILRKGPLTLRELCDTLDVSPRKAEAIVKTLEASQHNIVYTGEAVEITKEPEPGGKRRINLAKFENKFYKIGFISDNHLGCKHERLDVLHSMYDIFQSEGVKHVYNTGNWIDGEARFNKHELKVHGMDGQINYMLKNYPVRDGVTTHYIAGDDHEGWYAQRNAINIGKYLELKAREAGRTDLDYLGYLEADVIFEMPEGQAVLRLMHPGGGSAYALSYAPQKIVESFTGGEKPDILLLGHYHKFDHLYYRSVHVVQTGCTENQTSFMRKKKLQAAIGGGIIDFAVDRTGHVNRFKVEWFPHLVEEYYNNNGYYDV